MILTVNFALFFRCDLGESSNGEINRVLVNAGRAVVCDGNNDVLAVLRVGNADLFTTETGCFARVAVSVLVCQKSPSLAIIKTLPESLTNGGDQVVIRVDGSTSTCNTILSARE